MAKKRRRVPKDKATGLPKKYLSGAKNRSAKARELKRTAEAYKRGEFIDIKAVSASRTKRLWDFGLSFTNLLFLSAERIVKIALTVKRLRKTKLVFIRITQMKIALSPRRVSGLR